MGGSQSDELARGDGDGPSAGLRRVVLIGVVWGGEGARGERGKVLATG